MLKALSPDDECDNSALGVHGLGREAHRRHNCRTMNNSKYYKGTKSGKEETTVSVRQLLRRCSLAQTEKRRHKDQPGVPGREYRQNELFRKLSFLGLLEFRTKWVLLNQSMDEGWGKKGRGERLKNTGGLSEAL